MEFVLSQLCTRYRMFSEAAGLMNNKAVALPGLGSLPWPVLSWPQTFCLLTWIWVLSSLKRDTRSTQREPPLPWILAVTCSRHQLFLHKHTLKTLILYKKNIINTTNCGRQRPSPKQQCSILTVNAGLLQMTKLNEHNLQEAWVYFPAGRNVQLKHKWNIALTFRELRLHCWLKAASIKLFVHILKNSD